MRTFLDIRTALISGITNASEFSIDFGYENRGFTPVAGTPYAMAFVLPTQPTQVALGVNGSDRYDGVFQISLFYPSDQYDVPILTNHMAMQQLRYCPRCACRPI